MSEKGRFQCGGVILGDIGFGMVRANVRRFQEGDEPEGDGAEVVFEVDFLDGSVVDARKVNLLAREQMLCVSDALGGVVVARSCQYSQVVFRAPGEEPIEKGGGLCGWRCLVVQVAGENEGVDVQLDGLIDDEAQRMALVVDQRITVEVFADV